MFAINAKVQAKNGKAWLIKCSLLKEHLNNVILKQEGNLKSISQSIKCAPYNHIKYINGFGLILIFSRYNPSTGMQPKACVMELG